MTERVAVPLLLIAAGGTGGHLFPAEALATVLNARNLNVDLVTDKRATPFIKNFPARQGHIVPSDTVRSSGLLSRARTVATISNGVLRSADLLWRLKPAAVVGFGGYPTLPPLLAATLMRVPTVIHEQNAVMGRANRLLAPRVKMIATGYPNILSRMPKLAAKAVHVGNPVRAVVREAAKIEFQPPAEGGPLRIVVFGGSQGARVMSEVVPAGIETLINATGVRIEVVQQCRPEDIALARETYGRLDVKAQLASFFDDLPAKIARAHLVVSRAGASTVAELSAIGRPSVLVPLPYALDQDQLANATALAAAGAALVIRQDDFTAERLGDELTRLVREPARFSSMAAAARRVGRLDAAERLADHLMRVAGIAQMGQNTAA